MSNVLKVSEAASLGVHSVALIAGGSGDPLTAAAMAERLEASEAHLAKVLQGLVRAGILASTRGPRGGFSLARPASEITLLDVYEAIEGPFRAERCLLGEPVCGKDSCPLGEMFHRVAEEVKSGLGAITLEKFRIDIER